MKPTAAALPLELLPANAEAIWASFADLRPANACLPRLDAPATPPGGGLACASPVMSVPVMSMASPAGAGCSEDKAAALVALVPVAPRLRLDAGLPLGAKPRTGCIDAVGEKPLWLPRSSSVPSATGPAPRAPASLLLPLAVAGPASGAPWYHTPW
jgi:hypothetical protein